MKKISKDGLKKLVYGRKRYMSEKPNQKEIQFAIASGWISLSLFQEDS